MVEEGTSLNCNIFRGATDHDYDILDCDAAQSDPASFRRKWREVQRKIALSKLIDLAVVTERKYRFLAKRRRTGLGPLALG